MFHVLDFVDDCLKLNGPLRYRKWWLLLLFLFGRWLSILLGILAFLVGIFGLWILSDWIFLKGLKCLSGFNVARHLTCEDLSNLDILLLDRVLVGNIDQSLKFVNLGLITSRDALGVKVSLLSEVSFSDNSRSVFFNVFFEAFIKDDFEFFGIFNHLIDSLDVFPYLFIIIMMIKFLQKVTNF